MPSTGNPHRQLLTRRTAAEWEQKLNAITPRVLRYYVAGLVWWDYIAQSHRRPNIITTKKLWAMVMKSKGNLSCEEADVQAALLACDYLPKDAARRAVRARIANEKTPEKVWGRQ